MSLHNAAKLLKEQGRGPDDQLVHMSSNELRGLHALAKAHGGELSVNPNTGLPEAGFLDSILPAVVGIGLDMFAPGLGEAVGGTFGLSGAAGTGILTGGLTGLATGDLGKGLMAGLGAYGGANLSQSLTSLGTQDPNILAARTQELATAPAPDGGLSSYTQALGSSTQTTPTNFADYFDKMGTEAPTQLQTQLPEPQTPWQKMSAGIGQAANAPGQFLSDNWKNLAMAGAPAIAGMGLNNKLNPVAPYTGGQLANIRLSPDFKGATPVRPNPYYQAQYPNYAANPFMAAEGGEVKMAVGGLPPTPGLMDGGQSGNIDFMGGDMYPQSQIQRSYYATPSQMPTSAQQAMASYEPNTNPLTGQPTAQMASGGIASFNGEYGSYLPRSSGADPGIFRDTDATTSKQDAREAAITQLGRRNKAVGIKTAAMPKARMDSLGDMSDITSAAGGGTMHSGLGGYSDGGRMLKGPGDGMSDSIPATIGGKQPARLADGEFVVPADVVSHLGNGSTDAGAKKLYGMMDKIRKARTGKKKQAPEVKADKYIPA